ncbi:complement factor H-related protein 5-like isoform X1 [Poeciliopsis prolifica]|uniref:complement factor H-related protein 5-like isoform X1 n=1 Tax=Poeciliopsis prolifica TaxID=188132 RepID=UPI0024136C0A|nr:complement factor H-related protein 5-like isoform X1 [Poeciliopsis prolifica]
MKPLRFIFLVLQVFLSVKFSWSQNVNTCEIGGLDTNLYVTGLTSTGTTLKPGHKLRFLCGPGYQLSGSGEIECLPTGQWNASFPLCSAVVHCSAPPLLEDGDTKLFLRSNAVYQTGDKVEYICQNQYIMNGDPFQTCNNGVWEGNMRCMKPCTVNEELLSQHGLDFRFFDATKMYAPHKDHLSFVCLRGKRQVGCADACSLS